MSQFDVFYFYFKGREMFVPVGVVKEKKADPKCYMKVEINQQGNRRDGLVVKTPLRSR